MSVKNKLYKHHKSKVALFARNLSIALSSLIAFVAIVAIPTYFSSNNNTEVKANEQLRHTSENTENIPPEEPLENYQEK